MRFILELDQKAIKAALKHWAETEVTLPRGSTVAGVSFYVDDDGESVAKIAITDEPIEERGDK